MTGGAGFIGSHTVVELCAAGYRPVIVDNFSNSEKKSLARLKKLTGQAIKSYELDCRDQTALARVIKAEKIDGVIHFAAFKSVRESVDAPLKYYDNNLGGLLGLLGAMAAGQLTPVVFSSSCTVYGQPEKLPVTEDTPIGPALAPYGATKQIGELMIRDTAKTGQLKGLALRYFNAIGAHPSGQLGELPLGVPTFLVPRIMRAVAAGDSEELVVYGNDYPTPDGTCVRDYIHIVDLARAHLKALEHLLKQPDGYFEAVNIGTGSGDSVLQVIKAFEKVTSRKVPYRFGPRGKGDAASSYAAVDKAKQLLGWQAEHNLEDSIHDAWHWQQTLKKERKE